MFEEKTYYKLCKSYGCANVSFNTPDQFKLEYTLGKVTKPISGSIGILVFDSIEHAMGFFPYTQVLKLLECKVVGPAIRTEVLASCIHLLMSGYGSEAMRHWVHNRKLPRARRVASLYQDKIAYINSQTFAAPLGTYSVGAVKPIQEVTHI